MTERVITLAGVRADGWFALLEESTPHLDEVCQVIGERFVAFAFVAGARITCLTPDPSSRDTSLVDFVVGGMDTEQRLPVLEFRRRIAGAMLAEPAPYAEPPAAETPSDDELREFIGPRVVLLAPLYGFHLESLVLPAGGGVRIMVDDQVEGRRRSLELGTFRELLRERLRSGLQDEELDASITIDLGRIAEAEKAIQDGDDDRAVLLLGAWPTPLTVWLRTAEGQSLPEQAKVSLAQALSLLGTAYARLGRSSWADDAFRLAIQWGQGTDSEGKLFQHLGKAHMTQKRFGEAIGSLRRALTLGTSPADTLVLLGRCFLERKRYLAALVCAEQAASEGAHSAHVEAIVAPVAEALGEPYAALHALGEA